MCVGACRGESGGVGGGAGHGDGYGWVDGRFVGVLRGED